MALPNANKTLIFPVKYSKSPFFFNKKTCLMVCCPIAPPCQANPLLCHSLHCWLVTGIYLFPSPFVATLCCAVTFYLFFIFLFFLFIATYFLLWKIASSNFECEWILVIFFLREMDISAVQLLKYVAERELQDMIYFL